MARFVLVVAVAIALTVGLSARQQAEPFRGTLDNVPVFVTVTDKAGQLVTGLTREDFDIRDDGKSRPPTVFDNSAQPIRLIILIDVSGSMAGNLHLLRASCGQLIAHLAKGDLARIGSFGRDVTISPVFTRDAAALLDALPTTIDPTAPTPLWRAADQAIGEFGEAAGRRVVLILSDGKDSGPTFGKKYVSAPEVGDRAVREDVMVYGVAMQSRPNSGGFAPRPGENLAALIAANMPDPGLARLAEDTGGGYTEIRPHQDLGEAFAQIADELHQQYLLGFVPATRDGKVHKIDVRVTAKGLTARARKTYRAPK